MAILNTLISWLIKKRIHQIELFIKYPHDVQNEWLKKLLFDASQTEWGKKYDYKNIETPEKFKKNVPINDYDSLKPYIDRVRKGEKNILWHSDIKWFAKSSGTTNDKSKFIPVSLESLEDCHYKGGKDLLSIYCNNNPETTIFDGKGLAIGGSRDTSFDTDLFYGDVSAIIMNNLPIWAEFIRIPNLSIALLNNWEEKIDKIAEASIVQDVTNISGVPSWTLLLLKRILQITGKNNLTEVWPNLELYIHGGVTFTPYKEQFRQLIPTAKINYLETYNASEGFFGIQDTSNSDEMLLMLDYGIYYEFMPLNQLGNDHPKTLSLEEVELNTNYALIISTNAGLWRYMVGDTIEFTSKSPYKIKITGRTKNFINAFGEELMIDNAEKAIAIACEKANAIIEEYTAAPIYFDDTKNAAHEWLIEFERPPENFEYFTELLDNALKSVNSDYEAKRYRNLLLKPPVIKAMPKNTFYNWLKKKGKLGGQHKIPRLSNDRKFVNEILEMSGELSFINKSAQ